MLTANLTGKQIGDFLIEDRIGYGGMSVVYRALQCSINRYVALKVMSLDLDDDLRSEYVARFEQEANVIASLENIHILPIYAYGTHENAYSYLAMRLMRGGTLADALRKGPMSVRQAISIFTQVGQALQVAHNRGVIHRDVKPSNILLDDAGNAYLGDFGLAKVIEVSNDFTRSGNIVGTPAYIAPELVRGEPPTAISDLYSLAVVLYHMLAGRPPFELTESGVLALLYKHVEKDPPPIQEINPQIPSRVQAVVMRALRKNPQERYASIEEMVIDLNAAIGRSVHPMGSRTNPLFLPMRLHLSRRWQRRIVGAVAILAVVLITTGYLLSKTSSQPQSAIILRGERGTIEMLEPSDSEINRARERLGQAGFVAYVACTLNSVSQAGRARDIAGLAEEFGVSYRILNSQSDMYTQITLIEQARLEGAGAFILCPLSADDALTETLLSLEEDNVPVVFTTLYDYPYGVKLDTDSYEIGLRMGLYAGEIIQEKWNGQATVLILDFPGFPASDLRAQGVEESITGFAPQANILPEGQGFTREEAYLTVREQLQQGVDINVIVTMTDVAAFGAVDALQEANIPPDAVDIVSANAEAPTLDLIRNGQYVRGTLALNRERLSRLAMYGVIKQLAGATVPELFSYPPGDMITAETLAAQVAE